MVFWQVAAGDGKRDYSDAFLKYGVMLIGPGDDGPYYENESYYDEYYESIGIPSFATEVKKGDIVILKSPLGLSWEIIAAGYVTEAYSYQKVFDDVEGWDLQHCCFIDWKVPRNEVSTKGLKRGTFSKIHKDLPKRKAKKILRTGKTINFSPLPTPPKSLTNEDLIDDLINFGLRIRDAEEFTDTIQRIRRLTTWYNSHGKDISEHETRTFLIIPLILSLGWTEQQLKIEWKKIDIAFFETPYTDENYDPDGCVIILESKRFWEGLTLGEIQASRYTVDFINCKRFIVSDGRCYKLFNKIKNKWNYTAYLNVLKPKVSHPYEEGVGGAQDVYMNLMKK